MNDGQATGSESPSEALESNHEGSEPAGVEPPGAGAAPAEPSGGEAPRARSPTPDPPPSDGSEPPASEGSEPRASEDSEPHAPEGSEPHASEGSEASGSRFASFWKRHRTLFWTLHSLWALATGVFVVYLARERYAFVPWVVLFLALTWASTLYFHRRMPGEAEEEADEPENVGPAAPATLGEEATSYATRTMYQETLFFLLPFYAYSTVFDSANVVFLAGLGLLAILSCLDLVFDRWLRGSPLISLAFFSVVAFSALNLLIPMLLPIDPTTGTRVAAGLAVASALPLAHRGIPWTRGVKLRVGVGTVAFLVVTLGFPSVVPPVPLRLESAVFASGIDRESLVPTDTLAAESELRRLDGVLIVVMEVFAPSNVPTHITLRWTRDGEVIRDSREIEIVAHELGFRIWDSFRPEEGPLEPGLYKVVVRTSDHRLFGRADIELTGA